MAGKWDYWDGQLFQKAQKVLEERSEDLKGRQMRHGEDRLLTGVIKCAKCGSHMFGGGGRRNGVSVPYYVCSKRFNDHDCEQDYVRSELLDAAIIKDIKGMFRDEQFMARVWEEANRQLTAERPDIEKEIDKNFAEAAKAQAAIDRYFRAFEAGKLEPSLCNEKVKTLRAQIDELEAARRDLEDRRERLELPAIDREMLADLIEHLEKVMAEGTGAQKKDLLHRLVKKVLVHDRRTIEVWYGLPNRRGIESCNKRLPKCNSIRSHRMAEPEIWFRIIHISTGGPNGASGATYREQTVEIALGPKGAFENGNVGALTRRVAPERVVSTVRASRDKPKPPRAPRTPHVVELLRKAIEWEALLESGQVPNQAAIARREGITRARVTQVMGMLRLAPEIQQHILSMPDVACRPSITARALQPIAQILPRNSQLHAFHHLLNCPDLAEPAGTVPGSSVSPCT
ncbi:MAG: recombinase zinc beta ribbon domain-containing protein [Candidatus Eisenbacteria sp.]|nr:recombinase zinc beta ribbon domain-containing protein [Candidatus Eisenbacteria bacterium]